MPRRQCSGANLGSSFRNRSNSATASPTNLSAAALSAAGDAAGARSRTAAARGSRIGVVLRVGRASITPRTHPSTREPEAEMANQGTGPDRKKLLAILGPAVGVAAIVIVVALVAGGTGGDEKGKDKGKEK